MPLEQHQENPDRGDASKDPVIDSCVGGGSRKQADIGEDGGNEDGQQGHAEVAKGRVSIQQCGGGHRETEKRKHPGVIAHSALDHARAEAHLQGLLQQESASLSPV